MARTVQRHRIDLLGDVASLLMRYACKTFCEPHRAKPLWKLDPPGFFGLALFEPFWKHSLSSKAVGSL
jgi:hypothetical protein